MPEDKNAWSAPNPEGICYMCGRRYSQWPGTGCGLKELHNPYRASILPQSHELTVKSSGPRPWQTSNPSQVIHPITIKGPPVIDAIGQSVVSPKGSSTKEPPIRFCTKCGNRVLLEDRFCENCGNDLRQVVRPAGRPVVVSSVQNLKQPEAELPSSKVSKGPAIEQSKEEPGEEASKMNRHSETFQEKAAMPPASPQPQFDTNRPIPRSGKKAVEVERPSLTRPIGAFNFSVTGGIFTIAGGAIESLGFGWWYLAVAVVCGTIILLGARFQYSGIPSSVRKGSWLVLIFSIVALILTAFVGMIIGLPLCLVGAWRGLKWKQL